MQVNTRWKAVAEIYKMHSFAPISKLKCCFKIAETFTNCLPNVASKQAKFVKFSLDVGQMLSEFCPNLPNLAGIQNPDGSCTMDRKVTRTEARTKEVRKLEQIQQQLEEVRS